MSKESDYGFFIENGRRAFVEISDEAPRFRIVGLEWVEIKRFGLGEKTVSIERVVDTRPDDSDIDPSRRFSVEKLRHTFNDRQIEILQILLERCAIKPASFRVYTSHTYHEFKNPHYSASVFVSCLEEGTEKLRSLITKSSTDCADYAKWHDPEGWIEEFDLDK